MEARNQRSGGQPQQQMPPLDPAHVEAHFKQMSTKVGAETQSMKNLSQGFALINQNQDAKAKNTQGIGSLAPKFELDQEPCQTIVSLFKSFSKSTDQNKRELSDNKIGQSKIYDLKELKNQIDGSLKAATDQMKTISALKGRNDAQMLGRELIKADVKRVSDHKELFMDWMYIEMTEHSKKLQMYSKWFENIQGFFDLDNEFKGAFKNTQRISDTTATKYIENRRAANTVAQRGIKTDGAGGRSQSASAPPSAQAAGAR